MSIISLSLPVPKQPRQPELIRDQRLRIQTLFFDANFTRDQICLQTGHTYKQVCHVLTHCLTPQKRRTGRRVILNTPQRKRLIQWVTVSEENRDTPWIEIPGILGLDCGEWAICTAFKKEGRRDLNGLKSIRIGRTSNGMRSFRATRRGYNLEDISGFGLQGKLGRKRYITRTVFNRVIKGRSGGYFGGR
ncbi:hypothetical protein NA56DRAFT_501704 [Hyaloscypha hepaticicola]|uniref:Transposase Tc1-like domain-containing protein n=1 Tax=Hyaloscypha hepaticicola TaxID=2082293 RepID=A0A2J6PE12_9HELO|nr:hypothetical protein NA56DRAFT_501704 [Hyaloscypha hepaticicola]